MVNVSATEIWKNHHPHRSQTDSCSPKNGSKSGSQLHADLPRSIQKFRAKSEGQQPFEIVVTFARQNEHQLKGRSVKLGIFRKNKDLPLKSLGNPKSSKFLVGFFSLGNVWRSPALLYILYGSSKLQLCLTCIRWTVHDFTDLLGLHRPLESLHESLLAPDWQPYQLDVWVNSRLLSESFESIQKTPPFLSR